MLTHIAHWQQYRGPLIGFAVALGLALAGRFLRVGLLAAAAGGAGVLAGWYAITGRLWVVGPPVSVDALTALAAVALLFGLLCAWRGPGCRPRSACCARQSRPAGCCAVLRAIRRRCGQTGRSVSVRLSRCCCSCAC